MLCMSRKTGEAIMIGPQIKITINKCRANRVFLGIEAPPSLVVQRVSVPMRDPDLTKQEEPD